MNKSQKKEIESLVDEVIENDIRHLLVSNVDSDDMDNLKNSITSITIQFLMNNSNSK